MQASQFDSKLITKYFKNQVPPSDNSPFTDSYFKPNKSSLYALGPDDKPLDEKQYNNNYASFDSLDSTWKRASELFSDYSIFIDKIEVDDVKQGSIGNCYFLSALAALAGYPGLISLLFRTKEANKNGYYEVVLFIDGEWQIVILDDYFPVSNKDNSFLFCKPNSCELWAILLEKAWAKVNGGYLNTVGGICGEAIHALSSFPYESLSFDRMTIDDTWNKLYQASKDNHIIGAGTSQNTALEFLGLVKGHAYTVVSLEKFNDSKGVESRLVKLRNPWGKTEWNGRWSDDSEEWTPEIKHLLKFENVDNGIFWMPIEDFWKYFSNADIAYMCCDSNNIGHVIEDFNLIKEPLLFNFEITAESTYSISVMANSSRATRTLVNNKFGFALVVVKEKDDGSLEIVKGDSSYKYAFSNDSLHHYGELKEGKYKLWIYASGFSHNDSKRLTVKIISKDIQNFELSGVDNDGNWLEKVCYDYFLQNKLSQVNTDCFFNRYNELSKILNFHVFIAYNNRTLKTIDVQFGFNLFYLLNMEVLGKKYLIKENNNLKVIVPPKQGLAVFIIPCNNYSHNYHPYYTDSIFNDSDLSRMLVKSDSPVDTKSMGYYYSYKMKTMFSLTRTEALAHIGKSTLAELYSTNKFDEKIYKILSTLEVDSEFDAPGLIWNKIDINDTLYIGQMGTNGKMNGIGCLKNTYSTYFGFFKDGVLIKGKEYTSDIYGKGELQKVYDGYFNENRKYHGKGKTFMTDYNGACSKLFDGVFENGLKVNGLEDIYAQRLWRGNYSNGKKHGPGIIFFVNNGMGMNIEYEWDSELKEIPYYTSDDNLIHLDANEFKFFE
jgi:hypothetical protein